MPKDQVFAFDTGQTVLRSSGGHVVNLHCHAVLFLQGIFQYIDIVGGESVETEFVRPRRILAFAVRRWPRLNPQMPAASKHGPLRGCELFGRNAPDHGTGVIVLVVRRASRQGAFPRQTFLGE